MKKIIFVLLAVFLTSSIALADWQETFKDDNLAGGLNVAVKNALAKGISPAAIIEMAMTIDDMSGAVLATAMCNSGVSVQALQGSLNILGINQQTAMKSCGGGQGNISAGGAFAGAEYSSAAKGTSQGGNSLRAAGLPPGNGGPGAGASAVPPVIVGPGPGPAASGDNFN